MTAKPKKSRVGCFTVGQDLIGTDLKVYKAILAECIPMYIMPTQPGYVEITAFCKQFDDIEDGSQIPRYKIHVNPGKKGKLIVTCEPE